MVIIFHKNNDEVDFIAKLLRRAFYNGCSIVFFFWHEFSFFESLREGFLFQTETFSSISFVFFFLNPWECLFLSVCWFFFRDENVFCRTLKMMDGMRIYH